MFPFYFRRRHSKVDDDVEAITAKRDPAGPPRVLPRGHLGKEFYIYSHELTYISATNCFMPLGQSSGNI